MTARDFSTRPVRGSGFLDRALVALAAATLADAAVATVAARRELAGAMRAVEEARRDPESRRRPARRDGLDSLAAQALATAEAPPARIFAELASLMPADVRLSGATLTYGDGVIVELSVLAREDSAYDRFLERLAASSRFSDILPGAESRGGALSAPIRMRYGTDGAP
jgi:hypothetical protein